MRFMGYELTMDTKLTTDNQNIPFPSHSFKQKKKVPNWYWLHDFEIKSLLSGRLLCVSYLSFWAMPSPAHSLPCAHTQILNRITIIAEVKRGFLNAVLVKITEILNIYRKSQKF